MKKIFLLLVLSVTVFACKNSEEKNKENEEITVENPAKLKTYQGEFIYTADAAVLKGNSFIYGVKLNDVAEELAKRVAAVKKEDYDMVPVIVRGEVSPKPEGAEGWEEIITITEIVNVSDTPAAADVKLEEKSKKNI